MDILAERKKLKLSQSEFASYFHIPLKTLQNWEQHVRMPPDYVVWMIRRILELEKNEIGE